MTKNRSLPRRDLVKALTVGVVSGGAWAHVGREALDAYEFKLKGDEIRRKRASQELLNPEQELTEEELFQQNVELVYEKHWLQSKETVEQLREKYREPIIGEVDVWELIPKLAYCVDETDTELLCTNQLIHVQQIVWQMEKDGIQDEEFYLAAILHDLGKVLLLHGEAPENVVCANRPIGSFDKACGLDNVVFQWNHDEFIYDRLKDHLPYHLSWLLRYHSVEVDTVLDYLDERDWELAHSHLIPFREYDVGTKSTAVLPPSDILDKYEPLVRTYFPDKVVI